MTTKPSIINTITKTIFSNITGITSITKFIPNKNGFICNQGKYYQLNIQINSKKIFEQSTNTKIKNLTIINETKLLLLLNVWVPPSRHRRNSGSGYRPGFLPARPGHRRRRGRWSPRSGEPIPSPVEPILSAA